MIDFTKSPKFSENLDRSYSEQLKHKDAMWCCVCGKLVTKPKWEIHVFYGATAVTEEEAEELNAKDDGGDMYYFPIGVDCLRQHPELKPYTLKT